jgi:hypothetical protein
LTLFESESQHREKATIWRIFSLLPLLAGLTGGRMFRWFAVNIPMGLVTAAGFTSDIDIIAKLGGLPRSSEWIVRTWEVKVSLLCEDGSARSLKSGKTARTITQLTAYREFGSPDVSLLDVYLCEAGFIGRNAFPPPSLRASISAKLPKLRERGFGYQLLPFEHGKDGDSDVGLLAMPIELNPLATTFNVLPAVPSQPGENFSRLVNRIDEFFERAPNRPGKSFNQIIFCVHCGQLQLIRMKDEHTCPNCGSDLVAQS